MQTDLIIIREATDNDLHIIFSIWQKESARLLEKQSIDIENAKALFSANFKRRNQVYNYWVAVNQSDQVVGWQSLSRFSNSIFRENVYAESSTYIERNHQQSGLGQLLVQYALVQAKINRLQFVVAFIIKGNPTTARVSQLSGFDVIGELPADDNLPPQLFIIKRL